jgi:hypothetical protein
VVEASSQQRAHRARERGRGALPVRGAGPQTTLLTRPPRCDLLRCPSSSAVWQPCRPHQTPLNLPPADALFTTAGVFTLQPKRCTDTRATAFPSQWSLARAIPPWRSRHHRRAVFHRRDHGEGALRQLMRSAAEKRLPGLKFSQVDLLPGCSAPSLSERRSGPLRSRCRRLSP